MSEENDEQFPSNSNEMDNDFDEDLPLSSAKDSSNDVNIDEEDDDIFGKNSNNNGDNDNFDDDDEDEDNNEDDEEDLDEDDEEDNSDIDAHDAPEEDDDLVDSEDESKVNSDGPKLVIKKDKKKSKEEKKIKKNKKKRKLDEEGNKKKSKKKSKSSSVSRFFADQADVAEDDDDEEDEYDHAMAEEVLDKDVIAANERVDNRIKAHKAFLEQSADEVAADFRQRIKAERKLKIDYGEDGGNTSVTVAQQSLLPSINDPKVFKIKCKPGFEVQLVRSIMMKAIDMRNKEGFLKIKSAFSTSTKGVVYVEALNETFAKDTLKGLRLLYSPTFAQISISEMTSVMNVTMKKKPLKVGQFVRLKRGHLKGDLARVVGLFEGGLKAFIQAVPRPDYSAGTSSDGKDKSSVKIRPQQRLFDSEEARRTGEVLRKHHPLDNSGSTTPFDCWNNEHYRDGFLFKEVNVATFLDNSNVNPKLEELVLFKSKKKSSNRDDDDEYNDEEKAENNDDITSTNFIKELAEQIESLEGDDDDKQSGVIFLPGDLVQIKSGDLKNLTARIVTINDSTRIAQVMPHQNSSLSAEMSVEVDLLVKWVFPGAHVKVVAGRYIGQTGRVVEVKMLDGENIAFIVADGTCADIQCNVRHLQMSSEVTIGQGNLMGYELYDLVAVNDHETAVVINVGMDKLRVINQLDRVSDVSPQELMGKRNHLSGPRTKAIDSEQNEIRIGDTVNVTSGDHIKLVGTIKHISKGMLWLHSNTYLRNSGIFVTRARNCVVVGSKSVKLNLSNSYKGVLQNAVNSTPGSINSGLNKTPTSQSNMGSGPRKFGERDESMGKTVKISKGKFRGLLGQIIEVTPTHFQIELLAKMKKVVIDRKDVIIVGDKHGSYDPVRRQNIDPLQQQVPSTPYLTQATPYHGNGSETPRYFSGETPLHVDSESARTPRVDSGEYWSVNQNDEANDDVSVNNTSISSSRYSQSNKAPWSSSHNPSNSNTDNTAYSGAAYGTSVGYSPASNNNQSEISSSKKSSSGSINVPTYRDWQENMLVTVSKGKHAGSLACIQRTVDEFGDLQIRFRDGYGNLKSETITIKHEDVKLTEPSKNGKALVFFGKNKGKEGIVMHSIGKEIVLDTGKDKELFNIVHVALIN